MGSSPSTHSLVSGNLNAGVSYTRKTSMLTKRLVHALPYHATKTWALNSGSSSIANSFTLCIHSSSGHPGDTKNGRTYMTKCWRNDDIMVESECENGVQGRGTKKHMAHGWEKTDGATVRTKTAQAVCIKGYKEHKHCQHASSVKLTVRTVAQPWHQTRTSYMLRVCRYVVSPGSSVFHFICSTDETRSGQQCNSNCPNLPWQHKKSSIQHTQ